MNLLEAQSRLLLLAGPQDQCVRSQKHAHTPETLQTWSNGAQIPNRHRIASGSAGSHAIKADPWGGEWERKSRMQ